MFSESYILSHIIYGIFNSPVPQVDVKVHHVLSVEVEEFKREFLTSAHTVPGETPSFCLFDDVAVLDKPEAWCYTCRAKHTTQVTCDVFFSGPSCKGISYENSKMPKFANCYNSHEGCSGHTYRYGFKKGIEITCPAVGFFENTKGIADSVKDEHGVKQAPRIQVGVCKKHFYMFVV